MILTPEQIEAVKQGEAVRLLADEVSAEVIVLRADLYEKMVYDDSEWTAEEMRSLAEQSLVDADSAGPIP
jgi:hypothetical protein